MARPGSTLAARFRKAVEAARDARREQEEARQRGLEQARLAREQVLADLQAFGEEAGLEVRRGEQGLTLRFRGRELHFVPDGEGDAVRVEFEAAGDETHRLYREAVLGHRWVYARKRRWRHEDRVPLFDQGLEALVVSALDLPPPEEPDEPAGDGTRRL